MVPQPAVPSPLVDRARKEELILQKQVRQATTRMLASKQNKFMQSMSNLPTLIEASPDFNKKQLPFLPNLPASVQLGEEAGGIQAWFDQYTDTDLMSVTTDDVPSLYSMTPTPSMPHRSRCNDWRPDSRRRERSASITFDLEEERRGRMEEEERRSELRRRNSKKEKRTAVKEENATRMTRRGESPERGMGMRSKSVGAIVVKQEEEQDPGSLSMWSCRRCTLENPLQETTCLACGGSRLCSIGDIEPVLVPPPQPALNLLRGEETMQEKGSMEQEETKEKQGEKEEHLKSWHCVVCTLENEPLAYYCDACNTQSPFKSLKDLQEHNKANAGWRSGEWTKKAARYFAIFCFIAILATSLFNMAICMFNTMASMGGMITPLSSPSTPLHAPSPPAYVANQMPEKYDTIQSNPAFVASPAFHASPPPPAKFSTAASELHTPDSGDGFGSFLLDELNLEALVTQSVLGLNPLLLLLFSPLFLLLIRRPPSTPPQNPRVPMPGFGPAADAVGHPVRSLESLLQDPIFNSSQRSTLNSLKTI